MKGKNWKGSDRISRGFDWLIPPSGGMFSDLDVKMALGKCPGTPRADAPIIDRFGTSRKQDDVLTRTSGRAAFDNFIRPELSTQIEQVRENAPFATPVSKTARAMVLDDLIRTLDENGLDSSWLWELKSVDFPIIFQDTGEKDSEAGEGVSGMVVTDSRGGFKVFMNAQKFPEYSPEMKAKLLHELRHVWQHHQSKWKSKFRNETNPLTDMDVEVDAFERQFEMEKILGVEAKDRRKFFEKTDADETYSPAKRQFLKAALLYGKYSPKHSPTGYKTKGTYRMKTSDEYKKEYGE